MSIESQKIGLHGISPYVGKIRPALAKSLIEEYCPKKGSIFDPFCGSGTVGLEAWIAGKNVFVNDLNPYAIALTKGKLFPEHSIEHAIAIVKSIAAHSVTQITNTKTPKWVSQFYHKRTLSEILFWTDYLLKTDNYFILSCLLGILHHQRPGFLSFPSSHGAPYLRLSKFPKAQFPELYKYRSVAERMEKKIIRAYKNFPKLNWRIQRKVFSTCASECNPECRINTIITSPPYMKALTYARDNRLRLYFMGEPNWESLDKDISPNKLNFCMLMESCFNKWSTFQKVGDKCILIVGDMYLDKRNSVKLADQMIEYADSVGYKLNSIYDDPIPNERRIVKRESSIKQEQIIVFEKVSKKCKK